MSDVLWKVIFFVLCIPTFIKIGVWTIGNRIRRKLKNSDERSRR